MARPMPREAPVTSAVLPSRRPAKGASGVRSILLMRQCKIRSGCPRGITWPTPTSLGPSLGEAWGEAQQLHLVRKDFACALRGGEDDLSPLAAELLGEGDLLARHARHVLVKRLRLGDALALQLGQLGHRGLVARGAASHCSSTCQARMVRRNIGGQRRRFFRPFFSSSSSRRRVAISFSAGSARAGGRVPKRRERPPPPAKGKERKGLNGDIACTPCFACRYSSSAQVTYCPRNSASASSPMRMSCTRSGTGRSRAAPRPSVMICVSVAEVRSSPLFASTTRASAPERIISPSSSIVM